MTLRTKFLLALLLISAGLTTASLVVVRRAVTQHIRAQISEDLQNSVATFENVNRERETSLARSAELMADLPIVRALMTTRHAATIQDASAELWKVSGSDLMALSDAEGKAMAVQSSSPAISREEAQAKLAGSARASNAVQWWLCGTRLFEVAIRPIYLGDSQSRNLLGFIAVGSEVNDQVTRELSQVAASEVAFRAGDNLIRSTLRPVQERELDAQHVSLVRGSPHEIALDNERFLVKDMQLAGSPANVNLTVLKSLDQSQAFLKGLDHLLVGLGLLALVVGAALVWIISRTITRPLRSLVDGVRALAQSDFDYPLASGCSGRDEVAELTTAFSRMRADLQKSQRALLESEQLATIGRMASSISHDLRHLLSAIISNAEFLVDSRRPNAERDELYEEIRIAVNQMNDLIESLLEFSRTRESLRLDTSRPEDAIRGSLRSIRLRPEFRNIHIDVISSTSTEGLYDNKKLERVFHNLLLNACEAVDSHSGGVKVEICDIAGAVEIRVIDNGRGIPEPVRDKVFEPFFTEGKANGIGLGLTVAQKIIQDHGGDLQIESSSAAGTVLLVTLPICGAKEPNLDPRRSSTTSVV